MRPLLVFALMTFLAGNALLSANWPHWRGPAHNGVSPETALPVTWGATCEAQAAQTPPAPASRGRGSFGFGQEGRPLTPLGCAKFKTDNIAWRLPLPAYSGSTPIIWGDRIFLNVATAANTGELELWAVDRQHAVGGLEAADGRRQSHGAQAEHVVAVAGDRRPACVGDDRRRHAQGVRLRGQGDLVARHPEGLRPVRPQLGLRVVAAAQGRCAVRAGAARHEDRRSVLRPEDRQDDGQDALARRAADAGARTSRRIPTRRPRGSRPTAARS